MAALPRRTWAQIRSEVLRRLGNFSSSDFSSRVEYFLQEANLFLGTNWHHFELDKIDTALVCSTTVNYVTLPTDCFIIIHAKLLSADGLTVVGELQEYDYRRVAAEYRKAAAIPKWRGRFGDKIYFESLPLAAYQLDLSYYRFATAPDFAGSAVPDYSADCDVYLIELAVALASSGIKDFPMADVNRSLTSEWAGTNVRLPAMAGLPDYRERKATNSTLGGAQG